MAEQICPVSLVENKHIVGLPVRELRLDDTVPKSVDPENNRLKPSTRPPPPRAPSILVVPFSTQGAHTLQSPKETVIGLAKPDRKAYFKSIPSTTVH